jgi:hypothetical protein
MSSDPALAVVKELGAAGAILTVRALREVRGSLRARIWSHTCW